MGKKPEGEEVGGRNKLVGIVSAIKRDLIMAQINLDVGENKITAVITRDALDGLGLQSQGSSGGSDKGNRSDGDQGNVNAVSQQCLKLPEIYIFAAGVSILR